MKQTIVDSNKNEILVRNRDGRLESIPNTPYWNLKMEQFEGERLYWKFNDSVELQETYTNGIFNLFWGDDVINIGLEYQDEVADSIKTNDLKKLTKLYNAHKKNTYKKELIVNIISAYGERIKIEDMGFIIDDMFLVDRNRTAYQRKKPDPIGPINGKDKLERGSGNGVWKFICIVARAQKRTLRLPEGVDVIIDELDDTIIGKILFLLNPNIKDSVFWGQVSAENKEIIKRNKDGTHEY